MDIPQKYYFGLLIFFIFLLILSLFLLVKFNNAKTEKAMELEDLGYICHKNEFGIYVSCTNSTQKDEFNISIEGGQQWLNTSN